MLDLRQKAWRRNLLTCHRVLYSV